jgi:hypothetical protein
MDQNQTSTCSDRVLCPSKPDPTATLAAYLLVWPFLRRRIEELLAEQRVGRSAAEVAADHAALLDLERALNRVAALAARLDDRARDRSGA